MVARPGTARFATLLVALVLLYLWIPISVELHFPRSLLRFAALAVLGSGVYMVSGQRRVLWLAAALGVGVGVAGAAASVHPTPALDVASLLLMVVFVATTLVTVVRTTIARSGEFDTVLGGICGYLLLSLLFLLLHVLVEFLLPGAYQVGGEDLFRPGEAPVDLVPVLHYFSIVTITTLGYGDIIPVSPAARVLSALEALVGQIYLAVFVAALVGLHLAQRSERHRG